MTPDKMNATFESIGRILSFLNVYQFWKIKKIEGVHIIPSLFYWSWSAFNIWYYNSIGQFWSNLAGIISCIANTSFLMVWYYIYYKNSNKISDYWM